MLSSYLDALLKLSKTTSPQKLFPSDCITLHVYESLRPGGKEQADRDWIYLAPWLLITIKLGFKPSRWECKVKQ